MSIASPLLTGTCAGSLLSPPNSPQMSGNPYRPSDGSWRTTWWTPLPPSPARMETTHHLMMTGPEVDQDQVGSMGQLNLGPPESIPSTRPRFAHVGGHQPAGSGFTLPHGSHGLGLCLDPPEQGIDCAGDPDGDDALDAPAGSDRFPRFVPDIPGADAEGLTHDDEDALAASDPDEVAPEGGIPRTAAEERAEKRKLKRFRLTHSQTRFLQSEFARQAHPDAAQRERLSREIPGLSPRQVQVWFQNRRAKMKRLTSDDRERVMQSRALPEGFDTTQALYLAGGRPSGSVGGLPTGYSPFPSDAGGFPYYSAGSRHGDEYAFGSPKSVGSYPDHQIYSTGGSVSASAMVSPVSSVREAPFLSAPSAPRTEPSRRVNPFSRSRSFPHIYQPPPPALNLRDEVQLARKRAESLASPLGLSSFLGGDGAPSAPVPQRPLYASLRDRFRSGSSGATGSVEDVHGSTAQTIITSENQLSLLSDGERQGFLPSGSGLGAPDVSLMYFNLPPASSSEPFSEGSNFPQSQYAPNFSVQAILTPQDYPTMMEPYAVDYDTAVPPHPQFHLPPEAFAPFDPGAPFVSAGYNHMNSDGNGYSSSFAPFPVTSSGR